MTSKETRTPTRLLTRLPTRSSTTRRTEENNNAMFTGLVETVGTVSRVDPLDMTTGGGGGFSLEVRDAHAVLDDAKLGDSISINGACMTVTEFDSTAGIFKVGVSPETLRKTNLGDLIVGSPVNLERAMRLGDRFGGHAVQGHVDCCARILSMVPDEPNSIVVTLRIPDFVSKALATAPSASTTSNEAAVQAIKDAIRTHAVSQDGWGDATKTQEPIATNSTSNEKSPNAEPETEIDYMRYIVPKGFITLDGTSLTVIDVDTKARTFSVMLIKYTQERIIMPKKTPGDRVNIEVDQMGKYAEQAVLGVLARLGIAV